MTEHTRSEPTLEPPLKKKTEHPHGSLAFLAALPGVLVYPFRGGGWAAIIAGAVFFYVLNLLAVWSVLGFLVTLAVSGYLAAFMFQIVGASAAGENSVPEWPGLASPWDDILRPFLLVAATVIVSFLPAVVYVIVSEEPWEEAWRSALLLVALGTFYLPMALMAVALYDSFAGLNPVRVILGIIKTMPMYLVATALLAGVYVLAGVAERYLSGTIPILGPLAAGAVALYALMVEMHVLGLLYLTHRKRLGWFE